MFPCLHFNCQLDWSSHLRTSHFPGYYTEYKMAARLLDASGSVNCFIFLESAVKYLTSHYINTASSTLTQIPLFFIQVCGVRSTPLVLWVCRLQKASCFNGTSVFTMKHNTQAKTHAHTAKQLRSTIDTHISQVLIGVA